MTLDSYAASQPSGGFSLSDFRTLKKFIEQYPDSDFSSCFFEQGDKLGEGGMGAVYRVEDSFGNPAALKILHRDPNQDPKQLEIATKRFMREARITAKLQHPAIFDVYSAGPNPTLNVKKPEHLIRMSLIEGENLSDKISALHSIKSEKEKKEALSTILAQLVKVAEAISYAHSKGIVHRDLKPENIMIDKSGQLIVLDWGIAGDLTKDEPGEEREIIVSGRTRLDEEVVKELESIRKQAAEDKNLSEEAGKRLGRLTKAGALLGTIGYMSPEQADGELDERSDVFALGSILTEVLTSKLPTEGNDSTEMLVALARGKIKSPRDYDEGIAKELDFIARSALAFDKDQRTPSVEVFTRQLKAYLAQQPIEGYDYSIREEASHFVRARPKSILAAVLGSCLLALTNISYNAMEASRSFKDKTRQANEIQDTKNKYREDIDNAYKLMQEAKVASRAKNYLKVSQKINASLKIAKTPSLLRFAAKLLKEMEGPRSEKAESYREEALKLELEGAKLKGR